MFTCLSIDPLCQAKDGPQNALKTFSKVLSCVLTKISKNTLKHWLKIHHNTARTKEHHLKSFSNHHISRGFFRVRFSFSNTCESVHDEKRKKISTWLLRPECWYPWHNQLYFGSQKSLSIFQVIIKPFFTFLHKKVSFFFPIFSIFVT